MAFAHQNSSPSRGPRRYVSPRVTALRYLTIAIGKRMSHAPKACQYYYGVDTQEVSMVKQRRRRNPRKPKRRVHSPSKSFPTEETPIEKSPESPKTQSHWALRALSSPIWQSVAALLSIIAIAVSIWVVSYTKDLQDKSNKAAITHSTTYREDGDENWTMITVLTNRGPGTSKRMRISYTGVNTYCSLLRIGTSREQASASIVEEKFGAECKGGATFIDVKNRSASELTGMFVRDVVDQSKQTDMAFYSSTSPELYPGESVWLEFQFKLEGTLNDEFAKTLPVDESDMVTEKIEPLFKTFGKVEIGGNDITVDRNRYRAIRSLD
jgi:hypothetical protein